MISHPTATELSEAIATFDATPGAPDDPREVFLARVTENARATLARETEHGARLQEEARERLHALLGRDGDFSPLNAQLCALIRNGSLAPLNPGLLAHLRATAIGQIAVDQPGYGGLAALQAG